MGEAKRRKLLNLPPRRDKMSDLKIVGPNGQPIASPSNPQGLKAAEAAMRQPTEIMKVFLLADGTPALASPSQMPKIKVAEILSRYGFLRITK